MVSLRPWSVLLASAALLAACERSPPAGTEAESEPTSPTELLPVADPPLDRERLLLAVARAASDFAAGRDDGERQRQLSGRRFEVRLRVGCESDDIATRQWSFDEPNRVLRVRVEPELSASDPAIAALGLEPFEAVEGFWIRRPWLLHAACPETAPAAPADEEADGEADAPGERPPAAQPHVGIAHFFTEQDSRLRRRDQRAYETTVKLAEGEQPSPTGYDLVLSGRLTQLPGGRVIACAGNGAAAPPRCIVSADFDQVRLARPDGTMIAEW